MYRTCIIVVDASRARLFTYDRFSDETGLHDRLVEHTDLVNPIRRRRPSEVFSDSRPGSGRVGSHQFAYDDHRDQHMAQFDLEFARATMAALHELIEEFPPRRVVMCAPPRMLGKLRISAPAALPEGIELVEVPRDLVRVEASAMVDHLADYLLPRTTVAIAHGG